MPTFVIIPTAQTQDQKNYLEKALRERFANAAYPLPNGEWLVSCESTSKQLSDDLKISDGDAGSCMVLGFSGYWGRSTKDIWEWLAVNQK